MKQDKEYLEHLRHSTAHLLAAAVLELWPGTHNAIGPSIENGFYQDFDFGDVKITDEHLPKIEDKMRELVKKWKSFEEKEVTSEQAKKDFSHNPYKLELIEEFSQGGKRITENNPGGFLDLCKGGHVDNPGEELKHFKLLSIAGAYWRGSEKNKMLTRIYGTIFPTKEELDDYLSMLEEAEKRNHKKLGRELELFMFHETAPGMVYWLPKGVKLYNQLVDFWRKEHEQCGYQEIVSPLVNKKDLYVTSGHYDHYWSEMFISKTPDKEEYGLKAMNCPNAHVVFGHKSRSYKDLPLRLSDTDTLHRYELSGVLNGLLRVREFRQDDAHIYVTEDQIESEYKEVFEIVKKFYSVFNLNYSFRLGTRNPDNFMGDIATWNKAEAILEKILKESGIDYFVLEGDGAFYGPKVDILMKDALGRSWQMGTVQLDFQQPKRFNLEYIDKDGKTKTPIAIHRVIYGSLERFIGILIEHFAGAFPVWMAPVQAKVLPVSSKALDYAGEVESILRENGIRVEVDDRAETLGAKIRDAQKEKVPYMLVVGEKEKEKGTVSPRSRDGVDLGEMHIPEFSDYLQKRVQEKSLEL